MAERYDFRKVEQKWQQRWAAAKSFRAEDFLDKPKKYILIEFPYPSGDGLHVGHVRSYAALDAVARMSRMRGFNVLYPVGWDAFGLPTENYAIKTGRHPADITKENIATFRRQMRALGLSFDWSRELNTSDPAYYRWTQWIFLQLFKKGLAYQATIPINWCPMDKIGLANEEVVGGKCERCGTEVTRRMQKQWLLKITAYAERLLKDLDTVDYLPQIKTQQANWIGRSEGAEVEFRMENGEWKMENGGKILLATNNPSKVARVRKLLSRAASDVVLVTPTEAGLATIEIDEGSDLRKNAEAKARAYFGKTNLPILGMDTGLFLDGHALDPAKVKRNALGKTPEGFLTPKEVGARMFDYYRNLAKKRGGEIPGYFLDVLALVQPDETVQTAQAQRDLVLTDEQHGEIDYHFPIRTLYRIAATGKYAVDQTEQEEMEKDLAPLTKALVSLLSPSITVFTTRPDTLFGATYLVLAPEHPLVSQITTDEQRAAVQKYVQEAARKSDLERTELQKEKTGVFTGSYAINPVNQERIPIWVADYVLASYGTGAIMAVPAHDERDFVFAKKYALPIRKVIQPPSIVLRSPLEAPVASPGAYGHLQSDLEAACWTGDGMMMHSGEFSGVPSEEGRKKITDWLQKNSLGKPTVQYKLRDWVFSRQHYWGEPIPIVHCPDHGAVPVPEEQLPVELPHVEKYQPTDTGASPLASIPEWVNTVCPLRLGEDEASPQCGKAAKRETDTMPNWAGSSWYFLRYCDPKNDKAFADKKKLAYWMPVDLYNGGMEHTVLHLLYSRFWHKFLFDEGLVPHPEPYRHRHSHGMVLGEDGRKMSKSFGNVVNPDEIIEHYGADSLRLYEMFMGPFEDAIPWATRGTVGVRRFLDDVWALATVETSKAQEGAKQGRELERMQHLAVKRVSENLEAFRFNTAVSALMEFKNALEKQPRDAAAFSPALRTLLILLFPLAPHIAAELWERRFGGAVSSEPWPAYDAAKLAAETVTLVVQVNGKVRARVSAKTSLNAQEAQTLARSQENVQKYLQGTTPKVVFVPDKLINFVTGGKP